jgi:hypothetical protein
MSDYLSIVDDADLQRDNPQWKPSGWIAQCRRGFVRNGPKIQGVTKGEERILIGSCGYHAEYGTAAWPTQRQYGRYRGGGRCRHLGTMNPIFYGFFAISFAIFGIFLGIFELETESGQELTKIRGFDT